MNALSFMKETPVAPKPKKDSDETSTGTLTNTFKRLSLMRKSTGLTQPPKEPPPPDETKQGEAWWSQDPTLQARSQTRSSIPFKREEANRSMTARCFKALFRATALARKKSVHLDTCKRDSDDVPRSSPIPVPAPAVGVIIPDCHLSQWGSITGRKDHSDTDGLLSNAGAMPHMPVARKPISPFQDPIFDFEHSPHGSSSVGGICGAGSIRTDISGIIGAIDEALMPTCASPTRFSIAERLEGLAGSPSGKTSIPAGAFVDDRSDPVAALERLRTASSELLKHPNALPFPACVRQLNKFAEVLEAMNSTYSTMPDSQQGPQIEHQDSAPAPSTALTTLRDSCATLESEHCALHAAFFALRIAASDLNPSWDDVSALEKTIPEATATQILTNLAGLIPHLPPQRSEDTDEDSSAFMDGNGSDKHEPGSRYIDLKLRQMHAVPPSDEQGRLRAWLAAHWCAFEHLPVDSAGSRIALSVLAEVTLGIRKAAECGQIDDLSGTQNTSSYGRALLERLAVEVAEIKDEDGEVEEPTVDSLGELVDPDAELKATAPW